MTDDENPEIVAAASLSPVSPRPLHNTYTLPQVLPDLQHQAEDPDVVPFEPTTFRTAAAAMAPEPEPTEPLEEVNAEGSSDSDAADLSEVSSIADDASFEYGDGDGDGDDVQEQAGAQQDAAQEADDYARTFDSPAEKEQLAEVEVEDEEGKDQQPHQELVSNAPESMNISEQPDQPDAVPTQPVPVAPSAPSLAEQGSQPIQPTTSAQHFPAPQPTEQDQEPIPVAHHEALSDPTTTNTASPDQQSDTSPQQEKVEADVKPEEAAPQKEDDVDVQPKTEDVEMTTEGASDATAIDIQKLVDEITAKAESTSDQPSTKPPIPPQATSSSVDVDMFSLPPKPALTQEQSKQTYSPASYHHASLPSAPNFPASAGVPSQPSYANNSAPGVSQPQNFSATPSFASHPNAYPPGTTPQQTPGYNGNDQLQQTYDEFLADERRHMAEAKWERFPEGSRIFIGNLSQERVSKRDVFELFHRHGRLAQISLKSAYGFVQYHTVDDAQAAMNALQGAEVKGRKINLEISRTQKTKKDRDHSPERRNRGDRGDRGERGGRNADRYDGREGRRRDDVRQGQAASPRRDDHRGRPDSYNRDRDRGHYETSNRKRSRSPDPYRRQDAYRQRSPRPGPYGRGRQETDHLDIPRRYGNDVPDVQILLMQDVHKDFVDWVQRAFYDRGLKTNAMFLNPRFPRDAVIQRQVLEGVHGVVELDMRAQNTAKISLQVFDRSAGNNVRFDQYQDLDPTIAAQLVLRTKGSVAQQPAYPPQPNYPSQPYGTPAPYPAYQQPPPQQPPAAAPDMTSLVGQLSQMPNVDNSTLQTILASLQQPTPSQTPANYPHHHGAPPAVPHSQVDLNTLISNISAASGNSGQPAMGGAGLPGYPASAYQQGGRGPPQPAAGSSDPARDVENIMATLARYRQ